MEKFLKSSLPSSELLNKNAEAIEELGYDLPGTQFYPGVELTEWNKFENLVEKFWIKYKNKLDSENRIDNYDTKEIVKIPINATTHQEIDLAVNVNVARPVHYIMKFLGFPYSRVKFDQPCISPLSLCKVTTLFTHSTNGPCILSIKTLNKVYGGLKECYESSLLDQDSILKDNWKVLMQEVSRIFSIQLEPYIVLTDYTDWLILKADKCNDELVSCKMYWKNCQDEDKSLSVRECIAALTCADPNLDSSSVSSGLQLQIQSAVNCTKSLNRNTKKHCPLRFKEIVGYDCAPRSRRTIKHSEFFNHLTRYSGMMDYLFDQVSPATLRIIQPIPGSCSVCRVALFTENRVCAFEKCFDPHWLPPNYPHAESINPDKYHRVRTMRASKAFLSEFWAYDALSSLQGTMVPYLYCAVVTDPYGYHDTRVTGVLMEYLDGYITLRQWLKERPPATMIPYKQSEGKKMIQVQNTTRLIVYAVHECNVSHCNLSKSNFLIRPQDLTVVLVDFSNSVVGKHASKYQERDWYRWKAIWGSTSMNSSKKKKKRVKSI